MKITKSFKCFVQTINNIIVIFYGSFYYNYDKYKATKYTPSFRLERFMVNIQLYKTFRLKHALQFTDNNVWLCIPFLCCDVIETNTQNT